MGEYGKEYSHSQVPKETNTRAVSECSGALVVGSMEEKPAILHGEEPVYEPARGGLGFELFRSMKLHKDKIAQYIIETGESCTNGHLLDKSIKLAIYLKSKNFKKDDVVCLFSHNQMYSTVPFFAAKFIDVCYSSVEPTMAEEDIIYLFEYIQPKMIFVAENVEDKIEECMKKANIKADLIILGKSQKNLTFDQIIAETPDQEFSPVIVEDLKETAVIFFSSGTTGKPKGICCNHYSLLGKVMTVAEHITDSGSYNVSNFTLVIGEESYYNCLSYTPMYWISGIGIILMSTIHGSLRTMGAKFTSEGFWEAMEKFKPSAAFLPPGQIVNVYLKWKEGKCKSTDYLRLFVTGGGPVKAYHLDYAREMFPNTAVFQMLGMTEASGLLATFSVRDPESLALQKKYPESCGKIFRGQSFKIVDVETGKTCGFDQEGELRIKSVYMMNGYYKMDTTSCFDEEGWFKTGDLAYINKDECLVVVDRLKDLLLYTLYNIRPSVIEEILAQHPSVHEAFVIGIPHPTDNEHPMGVVKLKNQRHTDVTPEELVDYVNQRVPSDRYKIRAGVKIVDNIIRTPTGKIKKILMKKMILEGKI